MHRAALLLALIGLSLSAPARQTDVPAIVPLPQHVRTQPGTFAFNSQTRIHADTASARAIATVFRDWLRDTQGLDLTIDDGAALRLRRFEPDKIALVLARCAVVDGQIEALRVAQPVAEHRCDCASGSRIGMDAR